MRATGVGVLAAEVGETVALRAPPTRCPTAPSSSAALRFSVVGIGARADGADPDSRSHWASASRCSRSRSHSPNHSPRRRLLFPALHTPHPPRPLPPPRHILQARQPTPSPLRLRLHPGRARCPRRAPRPPRRGSAGRRRRRFRFWAGSCGRILVGCGADSKGRRSEGADEDEGEGGWEKGERAGSKKGGTREEGGKGEKGERASLNGRGAGGGVEVT
ncbi:hypothetical protein C8J57DRAFT_1563774 [Mycena rebaudengoi]|nr:hypothetical protein C8J57DRAFT_1563774 [Mycena rebaudengoi]